MGPLAGAAERRGVRAAVGGRARCEHGVRRGRQPPDGGPGRGVAYGRARFDKRLPGAWHVDLSGIKLDPRLPSPFTPHGGRPTGPAWYATPTVAYAQELGADVRPLEAWLRPESGPYLDPWYERLRDAYLATMADLGVTKDLTEEQFLEAMERHKQADPALAAVLSAIKATVKGGIGKLRERPQGARHRAGERWPALERPTWRPDIRAAVIAAARVNMHRKMARMAAAGHYPLAVLSDCVVYPSPGPSPLDLLPRDPGTGKPAPGVFRLGVSPGMVKCEGAREFWWAVELMEQKANPARHIKGDNFPGVNNGGDHRRQHRGGVAGCADPPAAEVGGGPDAGHPARRARFHAGRRGPAGHLRAHRPALSGRADQEPHPAPGRRART